MFDTTEWDTALAAMRGLQDAAIEADAEPGMSAGLHVHVRAPRGERNCSRAFLAFVAWESALLELAQGRFPYMRDMNRAVMADTVQYLLNMGEMSRSDRYSRSYDIIDALVERARTGDDYATAYGLYVRHYEADRHSNLSVNTRFNTWEFRLWNSTRSAWRMELACRLACAWADTSFTDALLSYDGAERTPADLLCIVAEDWQGDDRLAALIDRQRDYIPRSHETPAQFLVA